MEGTKVHRGVALIEVSDPLVLTEIESDGQLRMFLGDRLSDRCIAVQPQAIEEVVTRLKALGHMPKIVDIPGTGP